MVQMNEKLKAANRKIVDVEEESKYYQEKYQKKSTKLYDLRHKDPTESERQLGEAKV